VIQQDPEKAAQIDAQDAKIREILAKRPPPCQDTKRRAAALLSAGLAASAQIADQPKPADKAEKAPIVRKALLLLCVFMLGCVAPEAIEQARSEAAACHGLAVHAGNSDDVRAIGARESLAWRAQHRALTGEEVPGSESWPEIPARYLPAPADAVETRDARPTRNRWPHTMPRMECGR
jgi:hypothetical protein